jgi:eukaryotic-like serine/threonine-protein kinase
VKESWRTPAVITGVIGLLIAGLALARDAAGWEFSEHSPTSTATATAAATDLPAATATSRPVAGLAAIDGVWHGRYECIQGPTGLTLTIDGIGEDADDVTLEFYAVPDNPGVPPGKVLYKAALSAGMLTMRPDRWIRQPAGYVANDLVARLDNPSTSVIQGTISDDRLPSSIARRALFATEEDASCGLFSA